MDHINYANTDSHKGLSVTFTIFICLINGLLIFKTSRNGGLLYNPKSLTLISLAIGDIFLALLTLVVKTLMIFEQETVAPSCSLQTTYFVYTYLFIHFVYGLGLIILAGELVYRYKGEPATPRSTINIIKAFAFSAVPWVLGLIIVLPVTIVGTIEEDGCLSVSNPSRTKAMFTVCVLLPACLSVTVSIVTKCIRLDTVQYASLVISYQDTAPDVITATHNTTSGLQLNDVGATQQMPTVTAVKHYNPADNQHEKREGQLPQISTQPDLPPQYLAQPNLPPQYSTQQFLPQQDHSQFPLQQQSAQSNVIFATHVYSPQPQFITTQPLQDPGREKNVLLTVSIIFLVCVVPHAAYFINLADGAYVGGNVEVSIALMWLSLFRSIIAPIIWVGPVPKISRTK